MSARVLFFGLLTDIAGSGPHEIPLRDGAAVQELLDALFARWPALREEIIPPDAEVAIMPPVQGG
jgi:molybdopterin converting factor small subunit